MALWVFSGVAGSGKSSVAQAVAQELGWDCLDADAFHPEANRAKMRSGRALDEADREPWLAALAEAVRDAKDRELVLAFPGLKAAHRRRLEETVGPGQAHWAFLELSQASVEARLAQRGGFFPPELAASQFRDLQPEEGAQTLDAERPLQEVVREALDWVRRSR